MARITPRALEPPLGPVAMPLLAQVRGMQLQLFVDGIWRGSVECRTGLRDDIVVQIGRDASPRLFYLALMMHAVPVGGHPYAEEDEQCRPVKPPCTPPGPCDDEPDRCAVLIPDLIAVARPHPERVDARLQVRIRRIAAVAGCHPVLPAGGWQTSATLSYGNLGRTLVQALRQNGRLPASEGLGVVPEALHVLGGYRIRATSWLDVSVEGFFKDLNGLVVPEWTAFPRFTTRLQEAEGQVKGVDVRLEVTRPWFYGFVSYGYAKVDYDAPIRALQLRENIDLARYSPPHDRRHQVNVVGTTTFYGFDLSVRWQLGTGLPFNEALGFDQFILLDSLVNVREEFGDDRVVYEWPYTGRLPAYHRLDVSLDRSFHLKRAVLTIQASLINAYDRRNLFYLDLYSLRRVDQLPFVPSLGLKLEIQ